MNFFKAQDKARRHTSRLIFLFALAVICLIILTNLLFIATFSYMGTDETEPFISVVKNSYDRDSVIVISIGVSLLILLGSIYKVIALSKGGPAIAEMLGGQLVPQSTTDAEERKLLNIVEEMSIAAGMPIPQVYILEESSINAFAAGQSQSNAVIGVTRGSLSQLSRDELQGVIAHEFSHILNGDMRLNLRLMGLLHGILLIGIIGQHILNSMRYRSSGKKDNGGAIIVIGIGLLVIGYAGTFFGKWIKASVSRQREYLADASAVQFTRNKDTIAGALKKIGGLDEGSFLQTPSASEYSHAYFADGVTHFFNSMFATHPPLKDRIKKVDPSWNGRFISPKPIVENVNEPAEKKAPSVAGLDVTTISILTAAEQAINQIGNINEEDIERAHYLINNIPEKLKTASQNAYSARSVIYALLIIKQKNKNKAWELLKNHSDPTMPPLTKELLVETGHLNGQLILPLLEFCINALRELSLNQYEQFKNTINQIITADATVDLNEWVLQRLVIQQLDLHFALRKPIKEKYAYLGAVKNEAEIILSLITYIEHKNDKTMAERAFDIGKKEIGAFAFKIIPQEDLSLNTLNHALDKLMRLKPLLKHRILKACVAIIMADGEPTVKGYEIFRTISSNLDCPIPPLH